MSSEQQNKEEKEDVVNKEEKEDVVNKEEKEEKEDSSEAEVIEVKREDLIHTDEMIEPPNIETIGPELVFKRIIIAPMSEAIPVLHQIAIQAMVNEITQQNINQQQDLQPETQPHMQQELRQHAHHTKNIQKNVNTPLLPSNNSVETSDMISKIIQRCLIYTIIIIVLSSMIV